MTKRAAMTARQMERTTWLLERSRTSRLQFVELAFFVAGEVSECSMKVIDAFKNVFGEDQRWTYLMPRESCKTESRTL